MVFNRAWTFLKQKQDYSKGCPLCGNPDLEEPVYPLDGSPAFFACFDCGIKASQGMIPYAVNSVHPEQKHPLQKGVSWTNQQGDTPEHIENAMNAMDYHMSQGTTPEELEFLRYKRAQEANLFCSGCKKQIDRGDMEYGACLNCHTGLSSATRGL
jgi:hypothetical protein